jgi:5-methylcytosine-specific restriction endonuclease McrA
VGSNKRKSEFLGMSWGKARHILVKRFTFCLAQKSGLDTCFRCGGKVLSPNEMSFDHKFPWEGIDVALFWDLENIAISHVKCNRPHRLGAGKPRKIGIPGTSWCQDHRMFLPDNMFYKQNNGKRWNGLKGLCIECRKKKDVRKNHAKKVSGAVEDRTTHLLVTQEIAGSLPVSAASSMVPIV